MEMTIRVVHDFSSLENVLKAVFANVLGGMIGSTKPAAFPMTIPTAATATAAPLTAAMGAYADAAAPAEELRRGRGRPKKEAAPAEAAPAPIVPQPLPAVQSVAPAPAAPVGLPGLDMPAPAALPVVTYDQLKERIVELATKKGDDAYRKIYADFGGKHTSLMTDEERAQLFQRVTTALNQ